MSDVVASALVAAIAAWGLIAVLRRTRLASLAADRPNHRSLHAVPTPRVGGLGVMAVALPFAAWCAGEALGAVLACAAALTLVSFADDVQSLPVEVRLPAHLAAAAIAVLAAGPGPEGLGFAAAIGAVVALAWMANLFNFMDGADGLAGLMATIGFGALALAAAAAGASALACASAVVAAASAGFLAHNFPPARVFLGDAGSVPLGFLAGAFGALGAAGGTWPLWFPLLVFSPFIVDATVTVLKRLARGERIWVAHRSHYYQRLVLGGWSHRRLAIAAAVLMLAAAASAFAALACGETGRRSIISLWAATYFLLALVLERRPSSV